METVSRTTPPVLVIRLTPMYAWILMGAGVAFLLLSLLFASPLTRAPHHTGFNLFLAVISIAAIFGGNYWRSHLHVVAKLTPRQLITRRFGTVNWTDIAQIDKKDIRVRYKGTMGGTEFVCIKLKTPRPEQPGLEGTMNKLRTALLGYDIVLGDPELGCTADFFIAECRKRMPASERA